MYTTVATDTITMRATTITIRRTVLGFRPPKDGVGPTGAPGGGCGELAKDASSAARERGTRFNAWHGSCNVRRDVTRAWATRSGAMTAVIVGGNFPRM